MAQWARGGGFSVDPSVRIAAADRAGRKRLLRYSRPPPRSPWTGCTSAIPSTCSTRAPKQGPGGNGLQILTPLQLLDRLAALVPPPRVHRHRYFGVLAPNSPLRAAVTALGAAPPGDAKIKGTPYHATGQVPCSIGAASQSPVQCDFGVIRGKPGNAEVHVTPPEGLERVLTFVGSKVTSTGGAKVKAAKKGYTWSIEINDVAHSEIPEAVVSGG
jgi:hypothetical protein